MTATLESPSDLDSLLAQKAALLLGPGLQTEGLAELRERALSGASCPVVLDAGGLHALRLEDLQSVSVSLVLTPHPGEAGMLLGVSTEEVQRDRCAAVRELARRSGALVVLKGARTLICDGQIDDFVTICPSGGPELSTAGTGDVLGGLCAAFLASRNRVGCRSAPGRDYTR